MSRLRLGLEMDGSSRGRQVRDVVTALARATAVRGALLVAADGFVIAAEVPRGVAIEPLQGDQDGVSVDDQLIDFGQAIGVGERR